jgi:hypothetical protein
MPFSRRNFSPTASFNDAIPSTTVYFVWPASIARFAASLMWSGVSKSGSPAPSAMISRPAAFNSAARMVEAMVGDGLMRPDAADRKGMVAPAW